MITLLLWSAGFAALVYEGIRHGAFIWTAQLSWAIGIVIWWFVGAALLQRRAARVPRTAPNRGDLLRAVREQSARERADQQRHEAQS